MSYAQKALSAVDEYARLGLRTDVETASPHRLILLLLDGALEKLRAARLAMQRGNIAAKGSNIGWAMSIIDGLRASLNLERGGALAANLDALYDYMTRSLVAANLHDDTAKVVEIERLLAEIRAGWKGIETQVEAHPPAHNAIGPTALALG
jgi:flagellar secretion chaperone FliS